MAFRAARRCLNLTCFTSDAHALHVFDASDDRDTYLMASTYTDQQVRITEVAD